MTGLNLNVTLSGEQYSLTYDTDIKRSTYSLHNNRFWVYEPKGFLSTLGYYLHKFFNCLSSWTAHEISVSGKKYAFLVKRTDEIAIIEREKQIKEIVQLNISKTNSPALPIILPPLLELGLVRMNKDNGELPHFTTIADVIDTEVLHAAGFACCFHTTESTQEIYDLIGEIQFNISPHKPSTRTFWESRNRLFNNLVHLHDALPGKEKEKEVKIYWSERAEQTLIPHLLKNENVDINDLVFTLVPGNIEESPFQSKTIDATQQLQFVGIGKDKIIKDLEDEIKALEGKIKNPENFKIPLLVTYSENPLMISAYQYALLVTYRDNLLKVLKETTTVPSKAKV